MNIFTSVRKLFQQLILNIASQCIAIFSSVLILTSFSSYSAVTPYLVETNALQFGHVLYIPGSCTLAYDTRILTNTTPSNICTESTGSIGGYRIFANPNTQVRILISSHNDTGNGVIYVPNGDLISDSETVLISADLSQTIDSGVSGIIDIRLGGRLTINSILSSSTTFNEMFDIEFNEI